MMLQPPRLTRNRVWLAYGVAVTVDILQFALGPLGWAFADEILDVAANFGAKETVHDAEVPADQLLARSPVASRPQGQ